MSRKRKNKGLNAGTVSVGFIVLIFVAVMSIQIYKLKEKDKLLAEVESNRQEQLSELIEESEEIEEYSLFTKTIDYIIEMANKLGIVFENQTIIKEKDE